MKIEPKAGPLTLNPAHPMGEAQRSKDIKARAMSKFMGAAQGVANGSNIPVGNANAIEPIEMTMLQQATAPIDDGQKHTSETNSVEEAPRAETLAPKETEKESEMSAHYAILARKEKALRARAAQQDQAIRAREAAIKAQEDAYKAKELEYQSKYISKDRLSQDFLGVMDESGMTYEKLTEMLLNPQQQGNNQELLRYQAKVDAELKALRAENELAKKSQEDARTESYKQALNQIHYDVKDTIANDPAFETIKETGSSGDVVELIERTWKKQGKLLRVDEACQMVEDYLMEEAERIFKINKIRNKFQPAAPAAAPVAKSAEQSSQQSQGMKTLTNSVGTTKKLSVRDRAVLAMQGKLQK